MRLRVMGGPLAWFGAGWGTSEMVKFCALEAHLGKEPLSQMAAAGHDIRRKATHDT